GIINQQFSDENVRNIYLGKIVWVVEDYLVLHIKSKNVRLNERSQYYFSPEIFDNYTLGIYKYFSLFKDNFLIKPQISGGIQRVNNEEKLYYSFETEIKGNVKKNLLLKININYSNAKSHWGTYGLIMGNFSLFYKF
ncbi:MAG TPA: hypothetical protein VJ895_01945, partial [Candidatus Nanoarchaeia archaeon]|nr:hypothetical protein [Candidatus Nanoarchaeia archaeon]